MPATKPYSQIRSTALLQTSSHRGSLTLFLVLAPVDALAPSGAYTLTEGLRTAKIRTLFNLNRTLFPSNYGRETVLPPP